MEGILCRQFMQNLLGCKEMGIVKLVVQTVSYEVY